MQAHTTPTKKTHIGLHAHTNMHMATKETEKKEKKEKKWLYRFWESYVLNTTL